MRKILCTTEPSTTPSDRSMNGLVVFLTLFVFLAVLTSGLLVCLVKIWCGQKKTCSQTPAEVGFCDPRQELCSIKIITTQKIWETIFYHHKDKYYMLSN
ncbi:unnamed protein product [Nippostrongylus brasiliensis]|uniref:Tumor necrosis factor receptor superfamily member 19 n=1 Tax=Nippostrongylus brasiliensis TaxID=27835 RepID=A0A0N4XDN7_NIPBR|nr:unnamed protein product [Nippostrongylus brasiliensis]